jgi:SnoaL-like domain
MESELQRLLDERAIRRRLLDYCRGVDRGDAELVASVYHPDATDDHGSFKGLGVDFAEYVVSRLGANYLATMHTIGDSIIEFAGPGVARVETYVCARQRKEDEQGPVLETFGGRYIDRFECRAGEWKIADRVVVREWDKVERIEPAFPAGRFTEGQRGRQDLAYRSD